MKACLCTVVALVSTGALGCDDIETLVYGDDRETVAEAPPSPAVRVDGPDEPLGGRPNDSVAKSETEVITFGGILDNREMSRAERIRAFENLDPGALQKRVAEPSVTGAPRLPSTQSLAEARERLASPKAREARPRVPVVMYATSWCGVCRRARQYFQSSGVSFVEYDVDQNLQARNEYLLLNPRRTVPTIKVGNEVLVGFSPESFEQALSAQSNR